MIGQLIEELCIANIKLFGVCNRKADIANNPGDFTKKDCVENFRRDIELCKRRAQLKTAIDREINDAIISGDTSVIDEVKQYGS